MKLVKPLLNLIQGNYQIMNETHLDKKILKEWIDRIIQIEDLTTIRRVYNDK